MATFVADLLVRLVAADFEPPALAAGVDFVRRFAAGAE
jgi:hypothetical protein